MTGQVQAHPPKQEIFDVAAMTNTDNKGFVRPVEQFRSTDYGLYMSRTADHPRFDHLESWLLPSLGIRVSIFHFVDGHRSGQRLYLDVGSYRGPDADGCWHGTDWYLDLVDVPGDRLALVDVDELFAAQSAGLVSLDEAELAVSIATRALVGAAEHSHDVQAWIDAQVGERLTWLDRP